MIKTAEHHGLVEVVGHRIFLAAIEVRMLRTVLGGIGLLVIGASADAKVVTTDDGRQYKLLR